jgi:hypothetical protein
MLHYFFLRIIFGRIATIQTKNSHIHFFAVSNNVLKCFFSKFYSVIFLSLLSKV